MQQKKARNEFRVVIDGIELGDEVAQRISSAVQKAAMTELAGIDLEGDFRIRLPPIVPRPPRWGIWVDILSKDQIGRAGLEVEPEVRGGG
jgi:hypothetical protein